MVNSISSHQQSRKLLTICGRAETARQRKPCPLHSKKRHMLWGFVRELHILVSLLLVLYESFFQGQQSLPSTICNSAAVLKKLMKVILSHTLKQGVGCLFRGWTDVRILLQVQWDIAPRHLKTKQNKTFLSSCTSLMFCSQGLADLCANENFS